MTAISFSKRGQIYLLSSGKPFFSQMGIIGIALKTWGNVRPPMRAESMPIV